MTKRSYKFVAPLLIVLALLYCAGTFLQQRKSLLAGISDFSCFYSAGKMVVTGNGSSLYNYEAQKQAQLPFFVSLPGLKRSVLPFVFIPFILVIFAPLALLSYAHALTLWYVVNVVLLLSVPFLLRRKLGLTSGQLSLAVFVSAFFLPSSISLAQGQPTIVVLVLFTLILLALDKGSDLSAGCLLALTIFKPQFALPLLLAFVITKKWRAIAGFASTSLALFGVSVGLVGWKTTLSYPAAVAAFTRLPANKGGEYGPEGMSNLRGMFLFFLNRHLSAETIHALILVSSLLMLAVVLALVHAHRPRISQLDFSLLIIVTVLASYHAYTHDLVLLLIPIFIVANHVGREAFSQFRLALGMCAGLLLILPSLLPPPAVTVLAVLLFFALLLKESLSEGLALRAPLRETSLTPPSVVSLGNQRAS